MPPEESAKAGSFLFLLEITGLCNFELDTVLAKKEENTNV